ncbi:unannotated protein [freshwater metagenome]|uniref:Unannotated protein n=1 Tax=freshwater metagenome TaxID=449393 RepID=A0A6J6XI93_9ZZZZ
MGCHALAHNTLHTSQTGADLVLDEFADGTQATVSKVVNVVSLNANWTSRCVHFGFASVQAHDVLDDGNNVFNRQDLLSQRVIKTELLVDLETADLGQVITLLIEVEVVDEVLRSLNRGRFARTQLAVDIKESIFLLSARAFSFDVILFQGQAHGFKLAELFEDLLVAPAQGLEQDGDRLLALAVNADRYEVLLVDFELEPRTAARNDLGDKGVLVGGLVDALFKVATRRTHQLRHNNTLGAVDHEGALVGHQWEVTHEDGLALDFTSFVVGEFSSNEQRRCECQVLLLAFFDRVLRVVELRIRERQRHGSLEVFDRADFFKDLSKTRLHWNVGASRCDGIVDPRAPQVITQQ